jgi:hypothetical protein
VVDQLAERIRSDYCGACELASALGQSDDEFTATWLDTGHVAGYSFAGSVILSKADAEHIKALWETMATSSVIGRAIGRERCRAPT